MNANELADYLDDNVEAEFACEQVHITQAATMLRQQQNEIEDLKKRKSVYSKLCRRTTSKSCRIGV